MAISFNKIGDLSATFYGNAKIGDVVTLTSSQTVAKAEDGNTVAGICVAKENGKCVVQLKGAMNLKYSGSVLNVGRQVIVSAGDNEVKLGPIATNGTSILVLESDSETKQVVALF